MGGEAVFYEAHQAGIFTIEGAQAKYGITLGAYCPNILYPYARETISSLDAWKPPLKLNLAQSILMLSSRLKCKKKQKKQQQKNKLIKTMSSICVLGAGSREPLLLYLLPSRVIMMDVVVQYMIDMQTKRENAQYPSRDFFSRDIAGYTIL